MIVNSPEKAVSSDIVRILERYIPFEKVNVTFNMRVINPSEVTTIPEEFYIYCTAVPERRAATGWRELRDSHVEGVDLIVEGKKGTREFISLTPVTEDMDKVLNSDEGDYVGRLHENFLMLFTDINNITIGGLEKILSKFRFMAVTPADMIRKAVSRYVTAGAEKVFANLRRELTDAQQKKDTHFNNYMSARKVEMDVQAKIEGTNLVTNRDREVEAQIGRLISSEYLDNIEYSNGRIVLLTKPIMVGVWDIGRYKIDYGLSDQRPVVTRIFPPKSGERFVLMNGEMGNRTCDHPHIREGNPCAGNADTMLRSFWDGDLLNGFNFTIQYIKSYYRGGRPSEYWEDFLVDIGYLNDAKILHRNGDISQIDDGVITMGRAGRITENGLRALGCTGELSSADDYRRDIEAYSERHDPNNNRRCSRCERRLSRSEGREHRGRTYCDECFSERFIICTHCETPFSREDARMHDENPYCAQCYDNGWVD